jgi:SAM-dependent methyltransferase
MITSKLEQENQLRNYAITGNLAGVREILENSCPDFDINSTDPEGRSALFLALNRRMAAENRPMIDLLMRSGATIGNGAIPPPSKIPKLLTRQANAKNLELIFQTLGARFEDPAGQGLFLEIGSGDGYLKYLLSLSSDPWLKDFRGRIVETEPALEVIAKNVQLHKYTITAGISSLVPSFGRRCFSGVISFNVLDTFPTDELVKSLQILAEVLKPGGLVIHIMSSAIHENVFAELQTRLGAHRPNLLLLPYYREGHIGLRLIPRDHPLVFRLKLPQYPSRYWFELFAQNPAEFVEVADRISQTAAEMAIPDQVMLLSDYSREKIKAAFKQAGFELLSHKELTSSVTVTADEFHKEFPEANFFHNVLGTLITDHYEMEDLTQGEVIEQSTFLWIAGIKKKN